MNIGRLIGFAALTCLPISSVPGQDKLPDAQALLDQYFSTTQEFNLATTLLLAGEVSLKNLPIQGKLTMYTEKGGKLYRRIEFPAIGKLETGSDGKVAWERDLSSAVRMVPKAETQRNFFGLDPTIAQNWKTQFSLETIGNETVDGHSCFAVRMTPLGAGRPVTIWLDAATGLLRKLTSTVHNAAGDVTVTQLIRDYREEDGTMVPHQFEIVSGTPMLIDLKEIKINADLPADVFELPDDVRALAAESKVPPSN